MLLKKYNSIKEFYEQELVIITKLLTSDSIAEAVEIILSDGVLAFPTETVYGLGIRADSFLAYTNLFNAKSRPKDKLVTLMIHNIKMIDQYAIIDKGTRRVIEKFMPGPLTIVVPSKASTTLFNNTEMIGIRIPDNSLALSILKAAQVPMYVTSANISGHENCLDAIDVLKQLDGNIDGCIIQEPGGLMASTVCMLESNKVTILRQGCISKKMIEGEYFYE